VNDTADSIPVLRQIQATFAHSDQMQAAVDKLSMSGFDRADLSLPSPALVEGTETPEAGSKPASTEPDARQARTLGASTAAAAAALAAAGITAATGGAAAPVAAAAALAGAAAGGSVFAANTVADRGEQADRDNRAAEGKLVLAVRVTTPEKSAEADAILRAAGATDIEMIG
jgi:hypothetical protein